MTNTRTAMEHATRIQANATRTRDLTAAAFNNLATAQPGVKSHPPTGTTHTTGISDPTARDAGRLSRDPAVRARRDAARLLMRIDADLAQLVRLLEQWADTPEVTWCQVCGPLGHTHPHGTRWVNATTSLGPGHWLVCRWVWDTHQRTGRLPTPTEVDRHAQGHRAPRGDSHHG